MEVFQYACAIPATVMTSILIAGAVVRAVKWLMLSPAQRAIDEISKLERKQRTLRIKYLSDD